MTPATFMERFTLAADASLVMSRSYVIERLPDELVFQVELNASHDGHPLRPDQRTYPEDSGAELKERFRCCSAADVVALLWREGRVPEWIDLSVIDEDGEVTIVELLACGRFTSDDKLLYHQREGWPPFHALGPALPPGYQHGEKFSLHWRDN